MNRSLNVDVQNKTWPGPKKLPLFPPSFHTGVVPYDINIPSMLLCIGYLTTPTSSPGVSLSEFWAWVRYLAAFTNDNDLLLTRSFAELDAHQKTILSDDFGMGVPMLWLSQRLSLELIVDGSYFVQKFSASAKASQKRTAKRGPNKTPDFIARDTSGVWHIIECKGTQSGIEYSNRQLGVSGPSPSGGVAQKLSITFPPKHTGQRLACGLSIGIENGEKSRLTIIDPDPEEPLHVPQDELFIASDTATRGVVAKALRLAGFEISSEATASPMGSSPSSSRRATRAAEDMRLRLIDERNQRARDELNTASSRTLLFDDGYRGRELRIELPRPVLVDGGKITKVVVRQGIHQEVIAQLRNNPTISEDNFDLRFDWARSIGRNIIKGDGRTASMQIGEIFRSELTLE